MKIILCIGQIIGSGGMERVIVERVNYMVQSLGYDCTIITTENNTSKFKDKNYFFKIDDRVKIINIDLRYLDLEKKRNYLKKKYKFFIANRIFKKEMERLCKKIMPDIVISVGYTSSYIVANLQYKVKKITEVHINKENYIQNKFEGSILRKIKVYYKKIRELNMRNKYDKFLVLTEEDKNKWLKEKNLKNIIVMPNPLPFYPDEISSCKNKTIISVGRLDYQKGYDELVEVWNKLFKKYPDWKLEIYGEGSLKKELQEKIDILGMTNSLLLKGADKNIMERYLESSIYVMTSKYEGMPMVLLETMACGLPVVSFDCPCGPKDIIKDGEDGFLIRNRDLDEMAKKLEFLIKNENQRKIMGKKAHENIARYSKEKVMLQWKNLFEELVNKKENKL